MDTTGTGPAARALGEKMLNYAQFSARMEDSILLLLWVILSGTKRLDPPTCVPWHELCAFHIP